ncbi:protein kinase [Methanosarcina mazei Tuc01]|uniref:Protein kinase n=1 Tax=Methanosarcina mazei Tuc01 TaxID=1236903 RepID=M1QBC6_METMZ|nr:PASTA domain-containing protein [Methanosarcina mazei]AGF97503.1 protein kinase [Methanosarcina mazei Tuc01]
MTNIGDIKSNLEAFRKAGTIDASSYTSILNKLNYTEIEIQSIQKEALTYKENLDKVLGEKLVLEREKSSLAAQVAKLSNEKAGLEAKISILQKSRPVLSSSNLVSSFASSLAEMDKGLKKIQSGPKYLVSGMNVTLKTNIALEGEELRFQMPEADDIISPENLSTIEFSLKAVPEKPDIASCKEVPGLVGLSKEEAESKLQEAGFKAGEILEKESSTSQGTVIGQLPSEGSLAAPGAAVDLIISKIISLKVPDFSGLSLEAAKALIEKSRLRLEGVKEKPSDKTPGIVLAQSLPPGSEVSVGTAIVLTVSVAVFKAPNLLGLELESAKQLIDKSGLLPGSIKEQLVSETTFKVSGETPSTAPLETQVKASAEPQVRAQAEPSVKPVPNLVGMPLEKAISLLGAQEIKAGTVSEAVSTAAAGTVISQNPCAGSAVDLSVPVSLRVSKQAPVTQLRSNTISRIKL